MVLFPVGGGQNILFPIVQPALGSTQSPVHWVPGFFPGCVLMLATHLHLVWKQNEWSSTSAMLCALMAQTEATVACYSFRTSPHNKSAAGRIVFAASLLASCSQQLFHLTKCQCQPSGWDLNSIEATSGRVKGNRFVECRSLPERRSFSTAYVSAGLNSICRTAEKDLTGIGF